MNIYITFIFLLIFSANYAQTKSEKKAIAKIERQLLHREVVRLDSVITQGWDGGYEKITVYLKNRVPIMIEKELEISVHYRSYTGAGTSLEVQSARFYIINWKKNKFFRKGHRIVQNTNQKPITFQMSDDFVFDFDRDNIIHIINKVP